MIGTGRIADGIALAFDMARGKPGWEDRHDLSADAVFASFWALLLAVPGHVLASLVQRQLLIGTPIGGVVAMSPASMVITQSVTLVVTTALQVFVLMRLSRSRDMGWRVSPLVIGFNWSIFAAQTLSGLFAGLFLFIGVPSLVQLSTLVFFGLMVWLRWGILREALQTTPLGTLGTLVLVVVVSLLAGTVLSAIFTLFGLFPQDFGVPPTETPEPS